jgi:hypothetical protein
LATAFAISGFSDGWFDFRHDMLVALGYLQGGFEIYVDGWEMVCRFGNAPEAGVDVRRMP